MSTLCERLQKTLVELGPTALKQDREAQDHLVTCSACFAFLEALALVDRTLRELPTIDAPDGLVARTLALIQSAAEHPAGQTAPATVAPPPITGPVAATAGASTRKAPGRLKRLLRAAGAAAWRVLSFAWLVRVLGRESVRRLWQKRYLIPAVAMVGVLVVGGGAMVLTLGRTAPSSWGGDRFAKLELQEAPPPQPSTPAVDMPAGSPEPDVEKPSRARAVSQEEKQARVKERFKQLFAGNGGGDSGTLLGGGGGGELSGGLSNVIGTAATPIESPPGTADGSVRTFDGIGGLGKAGVAHATAAKPQQMVPESKSETDNRQYKHKSATKGKMGTRLGNERLGAAATGALDDLTDRDADAVEDAQNGEEREPKKAPETTTKELARNDNKPDSGAMQGLAGLGLRGAGKGGGLGSLGIGGIGDLGKNGSGMGFGTGVGLGGRKDRSIVGLSSPVVMGALDREVIRKVIQSARNKVRYCYEHELGASPNLSGKVTSRFVIGANGTVVKSLVTASTLGNANVESCIAGVMQSLTFPSPAGGGIVEVNYPFIFKSADGDEDESNEPTDETAPGVPSSVQIAREYLESRQSTAGVTFKDPTGYWANTYVPGDPEMRLLAAQLGQQRRNDILSSFGQKLRLDDSARMVAQPFDSPSTSALAVYVQADRRSVQEPTRMLVQVGLKGTERHSRARPAMNVGVVLDLRTVASADGKTAIKALIDALSKARDTGDKFSLVVAGAPGGLVVPADSFKHGPLTVAMQQLLDGIGTPTGSTLSLPEAMQAAVSTVVGNDDPNTPLGTSVVMLVTASSLGGEVDTLRDLAHEAAVNGVPVSVVGVGNDVRLPELDAIALSGQGNRRLLASPTEAPALVDRELSAVSRVVARALRLRIRLAPGVKLVDVLGSYRLDEARAEIVRQAEQSIDRRLSKNLGIASDRGEDEEGIQVVIPSFYAGDTHVILLDVVAPGPGPLADVRVRYKDLVYLKNGVSRANLRVERTPALAGPLEVNVLKNLLAFEVSKTLAKAGQAVATGGTGQAQQDLDHLVALLTGIKVIVPSLALDPDVLTDVAMLTEYRSLVSSGALGDSARGYVADSLKYSGFLKVLAR